LKEKNFSISDWLCFKKEKFIRVEFYLCPDKFKLMHSKLDYNDVIQNLESFQKIANGDKDGGPIALLEFLNVSAG
jgi:hypothetical protein